MVDAGNKSQGSIRSASPADPRTLIARAQQLQGAGRIDEAITVYRGLLLQ